MDGNTIRPCAHSEFRASPSEALYSGRRKARLDPHPGGSLHARLSMKFDTPDGEISTPIGRLIVAGWTGRDRAAVSHHIAELSRLGVAPPSRTPLFYEVSPALLTQAPRIVVLGAETSGEAEPFLLRAAGRIWLGLGSDHTDRGLESNSVAHSKQICAKPVARGLVPFSPDSAERCRLRSWIDEGSGWTPYQDGSLSRIMRLDALLETSPLGEGDAMLCGTLPVMGAVRPGRAYRMDLSLPGEIAIDLSYEVASLPVVA